MEHMLEEVEKACPKELEKFVACVDANPTSWATLCHDLKNELTVCSQTKVQGLIEATKRCEMEARVYEDCLRKHGHKPQEELVSACKNALKSLQCCTESVGASTSS